MRSRLAFLAQSILFAGLAASLAACSTTVTQEPIATASVTPRPPEGMMRNAPPAYIETGSLGKASTAPVEQPTRYRWNEASRPARELPPGPPRDPSPGRPSESQVVIVREGDTLYSLSRRYRISVSELVATNRLPGGRIEIGQRLIIPPARPSLAARRY